MKWTNRFKGHNGTIQRCYVTVDGTDFRIGDPVPFSKSWWTPKFNGPGIRYELACSIHNGDIVWFNGPFAPRNQDITIFRYKLKGMLEPWEQVVADKGYRDLKACNPYKIKSRHHERAMSVARARHETVNKMLKKWGALKCCFHHHRSKHHLVFCAVVVLTQLSMDTGYSRPFQLNDFRCEDPVFGFDSPNGPTPNDTQPVPVEELCGGDEPRGVHWAPVIATVLN